MIENWIPPGPASLSTWLALIVLEIVFGEPHVRWTQPKTSAIVRHPFLGRASVPTVTVVAFATASLFLPRMVHSAVSKTANHPTWDRLLDHISQQSGFNARSRRPELHRWIHGLILRPTEKQEPLMLIGPDCSGKTTFHQAMGLLLPPRAVVRFPEEMQYPRTGEAVEASRSQREARLKEAWLMVTQQHPSLFTALFNKQRQREGRYLKWCLTWKQPVEWGEVKRLPPVEKYEPTILVSTMPDMLHRLEDERDTFRQTLLRAA
jgi:hypothetical protein